MESRDLEREWCLLQNQFDSYEKFSLLIKLLNVSLVAIAYFLDGLGALFLFLVLSLWLQDAIWKTFQSRIEARLLQLEDGLAVERELHPSGIAAFQFNKAYQQQRPEITGLIAEYLCQAMRPTVAFPHCVLVLIVFFELLL